MNNNIYEFIEENWNNHEVIIEKYKDIPEKDLGDYEKGVFYFKGILGFMEDFNKAEEYFSKVLSLEPNNQYIFNVLGLLCYNQGKYDKAEEYYLKALEINPAYGSVLNNLGLIYKRQNKYEKAEECWLKVLEISPECKYVLNNLGFLYYIRGQYDKSKDYYLKLLEIEPNNIIVLIKLGNIEYEEHRYDEADEYYSKALELDSDKFLKLHLKFLENSDSKVLNVCSEVERICLESLNNEPNNYEILYYLSGLYRKQNNFEKSIELLIKLISLRPNDITSLNSLGSLYKLQENYDKAEEYYLKALEIEPESPLILNNLGVLYCGKIEYEKALKYIKKIIEIDPTYNTPTILHNLKAICFETNRNISQVLIEIIIELKSTFQAENNKLKAENNKLKDELEEYGLHEAYKPDSVIARKLKEEFDKTR